MRKAYFGLILCITTVFLTGCVAGVLPPLLGGNSIAQNSSSNSTDGSEQASNGHVAYRKGTFDSEEEWLSACVTDAEKVNNELVIYNNGLRRQLNDSKKEIASIKKEVKEVNIRKK